jgi:hypothetical protein
LTLWKKKDFDIDKMLSESAKSPCK